jgi:hypothetical protein
VTVLLATELKGDSSALPGEVTGIGVTMSACASVAPISTDNPSPPAIHVVSFIDLMVAPAM